jgi:hypothetical protein
VHGKFGDAPGRYATAKSRKNYVGTSPITRASALAGPSWPAHARSKRLADAIYLWAFSALTASPGAGAYYDQRRATGDTHQALRTLGNRPAGIVHGCLASHTLYDEATAWSYQVRFTRRSSGTNHSVPKRSTRILTTSGGEHSKVLQVGERVLK